jgi:hypothetical protein
MRHDPVPARALRPVERGIGGLDPALEVHRRRVEHGNARTEGGAKRGAAGRMVLEH